VTSTPTIFFADGKRMLGAYPAAEIEKALVSSPKNKNVKILDSKNKKK